MQFPDSPANPYDRSRIHPALSNFADELCATLARLIAYVGTLALIGILGIHLWDQLAIEEADQPAAQSNWSVASRPAPVFAVSQPDSSEITKFYEVLQHPEGGRKDVLRWITPNEKTVAELEIYRPGGEFSQSGSAFADLAGRMDLAAGREVETAGMIDSKFGPVMLLRLAGAPDEPPPCLGFIKRVNDPVLRISGWSCQGEALPDRRAAIGCMLGRLTLLSSGNEPKLAEMFARAESRLGSCTATGASPDWLSDAETPPLRGTL